MPELTREPSVEEVTGMVRRALYGRSPLARAAAEAQLISWYLPVEPRAVVIAARRLANKDIAEAVGLA